MDGAGLAATATVAPRASVAVVPVRIVSREDGAVQE